MDDLLDHEFLAELEAVPNLPFGTPLVSLWGFTTILADEFNQFVKAPVDMVDGVIITPTTRTYRLRVAGEAEILAQDYPVLAGRFFQASPGVCILDVNEAEWGGCTKA
jgi:hypothetical protein